MYIFNHCNYGTSLTNVKISWVELDQAELQLIAGVNKWAPEIDQYGFGRYLITDTNTNFKETKNRAPILVRIFFSDRTDNQPKLIYLALTNNRPMPIPMLKEYRYR